MGLTACHSLRPTMVPHSPCRLHQTWARYRPAAVRDFFRYCCPLLLLLLLLPVGDEDPHQKSQSRHIG
ncbi:hypothetical protein BCR43DRAFT_498529 [Syncephalastrum racemosum]|uniref:Uncharacterized protein n=1 Tax=Syncephalastrum racemosum TaxID=13706 RepID=A0A1X2H131_SYNRA|nr:hypothetical protein BCR43DRAFT_498529 [Syncephalastrum racemosum]